MEYHWFLLAKLTSRFYLTNFDKIIFLLVWKLYFFRIKNAESNSIAFKKNKTVKYEIDLFRKFYFITLKYHFWLDSLIFLYSLVKTKSMKPNPIVELRTISELAPFFKTAKITIANKNNVGISFINLSWKGFRLAVPFLRYVIYFLQ